MLEPYADQPDAGKGMLIELAEEGVLEPWIQAVHQHGYSPSMHAIGDRALRLALDAADTLPRTPANGCGSNTPRPSTPTTCHACADASRACSHLHKASDAVTALERLGPGRMDRFFPFRTLLDAGARLAFGSDWPIVSCDPFEGIRAAVTGRDLEGRVHRAEDTIPVEAAIAAYTTEARACLGAAGGSIAVGEPADLVLLDRDPVEVDWHTEENPEVLATIVAGRIVHEQR